MTLQHTLHLSSSLEAKSRSATRPLTVLLVLRTDGTDRRRTLLVRAVITLILLPGDHVVPAHVHLHVPADVPGKCRRPVTSNTQVMEEKSPRAGAAVPVIHQTAPHQALAGGGPLVSLIRRLLAASILAVMAVLVSIRKVSNSARPLGVGMCNLPVFCLHCDEIN